MLHTSDNQSLALWIVENIHLSLSRDFHFNLMDGPLFLLSFSLSLTHTSTIDCACLSWDMGFVAYAYMDGQIFIISLERSPDFVIIRTPFGLLL